MTMELGHRENLRIFILKFNFREKKEMKKSTWASLLHWTFLLHIHPDVIRSLQIHKALHTGDVTKRARNFVGDWMRSKARWKNWTQRCLLDKTWTVIYLCVFSPSISCTKKELQWILLVFVCVCVRLWYRWIDEAWKWRYNGSDIEYQKTCNMDMDTFMFIFVLFWGN